MAVMPRQGSAGPTRAGRSALAGASAPAALLPAFSCLLLITGCAAPTAQVQAGRLAPSATSQRPAEAGPTVPKDLQYFVGTWLVTARDPGTNKVMTIDYRVEPSAGGRWLTGTADSPDLSVRARDSWGIDPASGGILRFVFDSSGAYGIVRSRGWEGDRLVLEGEAQSQAGATKVRETITRTGNDQFQAVWEAWQEGRWQAYSIEQVRRQ